MNKTIIYLILFSFSLLTSCSNELKIEEYYSKEEYRIEMRDGKTLFTTVYAPKDTSEHHPILILRTPYGCTPYGKEFKERIFQGLNC